MVDAVDALVLWAGFGIVVGTVIAFIRGALVRDP